MYQVRHEGSFTIIRACGDLGRSALAELVELVARCQGGGRVVVVDLSRVTHLHYAGVSLLRSVPGLRAIGASRYVRDLVYAGGGAGYVELYPDLEEALLAA
jgi:ABC-type transporter Mla MlaB component